MRCTQLFAVAVALVPVAAVASPAEPLLSVEGGPAVAIDGRLGAGGDLRGALEWKLSERVALGGGLEATVAAWSDVGDERSGDLVGLGLFAQAHVGIHITPTLRIEPAAGFGMLHSRGRDVRGTLPAYASSVALVSEHLRVGIDSRVTLGELTRAAGAFAPQTQLTAFIGWQS